MNFRRRRQPSKATFHADIALELTGHEGYATSFAVEVEFSAERDWPASDDDPGSAGDREILGVRVYSDVFKAAGAVIRERTYLEQPAWLVENIKDCIDVDALTADWSDVEE